MHRDVAGSGSKRFYLIFGKNRVDGAEGQGLQESYKPCRLIVYIDVWGLYLFVHSNVVSMDEVKPRIVKQGFKVKVK